ncbi:MAG TPA: hypothetical protein VE421_03905 [Burkholderiaceae bacterium]|jgi:hypothetical protein|nr:hypothetical protein [Burkholderiaceae bacterium]
MPASTLDVDESTPPVTHKGHGTEALGPSDSSDSGSDLQGPGLYEIDADVIGLDRGTNEDMPHAGGAGRDVGDANLDSDTDAGGTGERAAAGRDLVDESGSDIAPDRLLGSGVPIPADALDRIAIEEENDPDSDDDDLKA